MGGRKNPKLQDTFLNHVRKNKTPLTIFLINGVKLQGIVSWFDNFCVLLRRDGHSQLVYKHAISTIMPGGPVNLNEQDGDRAPRVERASDDGEDAGREAPRKRRRGGEETRAPRMRTLVLVPVWKRQVRVGAKTKPFPQIHSPENRLAEAVGLAKAIDLDVVDATIVPLSEPRPSTLLGSGKVDEVGQRVRRSRDRSRHHRPHRHAGAAAQSREGVECQGPRSHRAHSRNFRRPRQNARRRAAGRAGASHVSEGPACPRLDAFGTPARRLRLSRRPGRSADRTRPPHDPRPHRCDQARPGGCRAKPAVCTARGGARCRIRSSRSSAIPTPANRRFSTRSPVPASSPWIRFSRRSIRRCAR